MRRNSRQIRRLSRLYDWKINENDQLIPVQNVNLKTPVSLISRRKKKEIFSISSSSLDRRALHDVSQACANDSYILETILHNYNRHKIPGGQVTVEVEVWVQEITTISDITSDFQVRNILIICF